MNNSNNNNNDNQKKPQIKRAHTHTRHNWNMIVIAVNLIRFNYEWQKQNRKYSEVVSTFGGIWFEYARCAQHDSINLMNISAFTCCCYCIASVQMWIHTHTKSTSTHARLYTSNSVRIESLRTTLTTSWVKMFYNGTRWRAKAQQLHTVVLYDNTTNPASERKKKQIDDDKTNNSTWRLKQARYMYKFQ